MATSMTRLLNIADILFGLFSLLGGGLIALIGAVIFGAGAYGFIVGIHGGPITAAVMTIFGAALLFVGCFCGGHGIKMIRHKNKAKVNSL
jgi:hypothetical protein